MEVAPDEGVVSTPLLAEGSPLLSRSGTYGEAEGSKVGVSFSAGMVTLDGALSVLVTGVAPFDAVSLAWKYESVGLARRVLGTEGCVLI